jgi:glyoxylase-like metal-dependent hydrolase (beta-lactamase superfamily II)
VNEILPGAYHWETFYPKIRQVVHSHYWAPGKTAIDPLLGGDDRDAVLDALRERGVDQIVLSNRHHWRSSGELRAAFPNAPVLCNDKGLWEFEDDDRDVEGFAFGALVAPGLKALEYGAICPEDTVLRLDTAEGALLFADGLVNWEGELAFVPDFLLGDPEQDKRNLLDGLRRLLEEDFDHLLFAHGEPWIGGGKEAVRAFVDAGGRQVSF